MVPVRDLAGFSTGVQGLGLGGMGFRLRAAVSGFGLSGLSGFQGFEVSGIRVLGTRRVFGLRLLEALEGLSA